MTRNTEKRKAALARAEAVLDLHAGESDCSMVEVLAELQAWAEAHDLDWECLLAAANEQYASR